MCVGFCCCRLVFSARQTVDAAIVVVFIKTRHCFGLSRAREPLKAPLYFLLGFGNGFREHPTAMWFATAHWRDTAASTCTDGSLSIALLVQFVFYHTCRFVDLLLYLSVFLDFKGVGEMHKKNIHWRTNAETQVKSNVRPHMPGC